MIVKSIAILNEIGLRLENISQANGYSFDINKIVRSAVNEFSGDDLPIIFYRGENDTLVQNQTHNEERLMIVTITGFARTRDYALIDQAYKFGADIHAAINRFSKSPQLLDDIDLDLGCLIEALDVREIVPIVGTGDQPFYGVEVVSEVKYNIQPGIMYIDEP